MGLADSVEHQIAVEGLAALLYTVTDVSDPIEVGGQTTYEVHIVNQGSKTATNLQLGALIPPAWKPLTERGRLERPSTARRSCLSHYHDWSPKRIRLTSIHVKGTTPGDKRIQIQLISDDLQEPVTKEESTHVYADE